MVAVAVRVAAPADEVAAGSLLDRFDMEPLF